MLNLQKSEKKPKKDPNFKAVIEYTRDLLCIEELTFDKWFEQRKAELEEKAIEKSCE